MRAAIYGYVEKNGDWKIGLTLAPTVTKWWHRQRGAAIGSLLTPPIPLYLALFLQEKIAAREEEDGLRLKNGSRTNEAFKEGDGYGQIERKISRVILSSLEDLSRSLPHTSDLWEQSKRKSFPDASFPIYTEDLLADKEKIASAIEGRYWMIEHVERALRQKGMMLLGEKRMMRREKGAGKDPWLEGEKRLIRRTYLLMLIQVLHHEGRISLTSGMRLMAGSKEKGIKIRCERCHTLYDRWQGQLCGVCEQVDMVCETCLSMGASKGCKIVIAAPLQGERPSQQGEPLTYQEGAQPYRGETLSPYTGIPLLKWEGELTPAQQDASDAAVDFILGRDALPTRELLIHAVTGAGKTEVVFQAIHTALRQGKKVLIATPRKEVVIELSPRIKEVFPTVKMVSLYGGSGQNGENGDLVIATTHQALNFYRAFPLVIVDEIDAFPFHNNPMLQIAVDRALTPEGKKILLTATPSEEILKSVREGKIAPVLIPIRHHRHPLPVPILRYESDLEKKIRRNRLPKEVDRFIRNLLHAKRQAFLFVPRIDLVDRLVELIRQRGPAIEVGSEEVPSGQSSSGKEAEHYHKTDQSIAYHSEILGQSGIKQREESDGMSFSWVEGVYAGELRRDEKIAAFRGGKIRLLVTTTILERGVTIPSLDVCVFMADAPIFDAGSLIQISGRVGRSADDPAGEILFLAESRSKAMVEAVKGIKGMNREAERKGYLPQKKKGTPWWPRLFS